MVHAHHTPGLSCWLPSEQGWPTERGRRWLAGEAGHVSSTLILFSMVATVSIHSDSNPPLPQFQGSLRSGLCISFPQPPSQGEVMTSSFSPEWTTCSPFISLSFIQSANTQILASWTSTARCWAPSRSYVPAWEQVIGQTDRHQR